jgi:stalled ribosome rescue protein Dom34
MNVAHVALWLDHKEAKIFHIDPETFSEKTIKAPHHQVTRKGEEHGRHAGNKPFYDEIAAALASAAQVLVVGPSSAKLDFIRHLHTHDAGLEGRVVGVETLDHPTDGQLAAYVRHYFDDKDRMDGKRP